MDIPRRDGVTVCGGRRPWDWTILTTGLR